MSCPVCNRVVSLLRFLGHSLIPRAGRPPAVVCLMLCSACLPKAMYMPARSVFLIDESSYSAARTLVQAVYE
jgi:hypothetical protein